MASVELSAREAVLLSNCLSTIIGSCMGDLTTSLGASKLAIEQALLFGKLDLMALYEKLMTSALPEGAEEVGPNAKANRARYN